MKITPPTTMATPSRRSGFTLLETLITVALLAILASVAMTAGRSTGTNSIESAARILAADLRLARNLAVQYNTDFTIQFDLKNNAYELRHTGSGNPPTPRNPLASPAEQNGPYRVHIDRLNSPGRSGERVRFAGASLKDSARSVGDVTFGPLGGTGPARNEDTVILLSAGIDRGTQLIQLTVSWVTGQVWIVPVEMAKLAL